MSSIRQTAQEPTPQKRNGAYYTPEWLAAMLVSHAVRGPAVSLLDPACGDGRILAHHRSSIGVERDARAANAARQRAPQARIANEEFFAWAERARRGGERFDCVAGNPPFIRYQTFNGDVRRRALALCSELGVAFSGLSASWAPFLVVAASLLRPSGRMAFVVPAAIGHAPYAGPLLEFLVARFRSVFVVAVRRKLFPSLSEDCWLLFADGFGGSTEEVGFAAVDALRCQDAVPRPCIRIDVGAIRRPRRRHPGSVPAKHRAQCAGAAAKGAHGGACGSLATRRRPDAAAAHSQGGARSGAGSTLLGERRRPECPGGVQVSAPNPVVCRAGRPGAGVLSHLHGRTGTEPGPERCPGHLLQRPARHSTEAPRRGRQAARRLVRAVDPAQLRTRRPRLGRRRAQTGTPRSRPGDPPARSGEDDPARCGDRPGGMHDALLETLCRTTSRLRDNPELDYEVRIWRE